MELRAGFFSIDDDKLGPFPGYTAGQTWNGWACPYFTKAVADQIAAPWNLDPTNGMSALYDATSDTYTFNDTQNAMEPETFQGERHTANGQPCHVYPIGNGSWVWEEDPQPPGSV